MTIRIGIVSLKFDAGALVSRLDASPTKKGLWSPVGAASCRETPNGAVAKGLTPSRNCEEEGEAMGIHLDPYD